MMDTAFLEEAACFSELSKFYKNTYKPVKALVREDIKLDAVLKYKPKGMAVRAAARAALLEAGVPHYWNRLEDETKRQTLLDKQRRKKIIAVPDSFVRLIMKRHTLRLPSDVRAASEFN